MIEKWELVHSPFEKDAYRHKVRVRSTEEELQELMQKVPAKCGRPFVTLSQEFNWAFYIYGLTDAIKEKAVETLRSFSPNGRLVSTSPLKVDKEMPPLLEDVLEAAAKTFFKTKEETQTKEELPKSEPAQQALDPAPAKSVVAAPPAAPTQPVAAPAPAPAVSAAPAHQPEITLAVLSSPLNPKYVFSEFIVGPNNRFTHAAAQAVAENPGKIYNPFFIYGGVGLGKTHLIQAIGHTVVSRNPQTKLVYISSESFASLVIEVIRSGRMNSLREQIRGLDLLLIDDVQFLSGSESTQEEFFHVFNSLHELGKQIAITSDRPPKLLSTLEDRLRSRFEWGLITDLKSPNLETRVAILKKKCEMIGVVIKEEFLMHIAERTKSNIRELEGILKKIHAYTNLTKENLDLKLLDEILTEAGAPPAEPKAAPVAPPVVAREKAEPPPAKPAVAAQAQVPPVAVSPAAPKEPVPPVKPPEAVPADAAKNLSQKLASAFQPDAKPQTPPEPVETKPAALAGPLSGSAQPEGTKLGASVFPSALKSSSSGAKPPETKLPPSPLQKLAPESSPPQESAKPAETKKEEEKTQSKGAETPDPLKGKSAVSAPAPAPAPRPELPKQDQKIEVKLPSYEGKVPSSAPAAPAAAKPVPPKEEPKPEIKAPAKAMTSAPEPEEEVDPSLRPVDVVCFYPKGKEAEFEVMKQKFKDIVKKHKLKIRLSRLGNLGFEYESGVDYNSFAKECKSRKCETALVLAPPPSPALSEDDFAGTLSNLLEAQKISLQYIPWSESSKDYRYLNCALDLSLSIPLHGKDG